MRPTSGTTAAAAALGPEVGVLASTVAATTGCGAPHTPWIIVVGPGQKINITVVDFAAPNVNRTSAGGTGSSSGFTHCQVYAVIKEKATGRSSTVCGSGGGGTLTTERERNVFLSDYNTVEIRMITAKTAARDGSQYLLIYEGRRANGRTNGRTDVRTYMRTEDGPTDSTTD